MKRFIGKLIWNMAERFGVDLGRYTHVVFGWMIGSKGREITSTASPTHPPRPPEPERHLS